MTEDYISQASIVIMAPIAKVWDALINPAIIKQYIFGTDAVSDWKVGSPITYSGIWEGTTYTDKGVILDIIPEKRLVTTYWSSMSGIADIPENYKKITYEVTEEGEGTRLTITQSNNDTEKAKKESDGNWSMVLYTLKKILEV